MNNEHRRKDNHQKFRYPTSSQQTTNFKEVKKHITTRIKHEVEDGYDIAYLLKGGKFEEFTFESDDDLATFLDNFQQASSMIFHEHCDTRIRKILKALPNFENFLMRSPILLLKEIKNIMMKPTKSITFSEEVGVEENNNNIE